MGPSCWFEKLFLCFWYLNSFQMMSCCLLFSRLQTADSLRQEKIKDDQCRAIKAGDTTWGISCRGKSWQLQSFSYLWILDYKNHKDRTKVEKGRGRFWIQVFSYWEGGYVASVSGSNPLWTFTLRRSPWWATARRALCSCSLDCRPS